MASHQPLTLEFWSRGGQSANDPALAQPAAKPLAFEPDARFYAARLRLPARGTLVLQLASPRPLRIHVNHDLLLDEPLYWRWFTRELRAAVVCPARAGTVDLLIETGPRPQHPSHIDHECPSRNRQKVMDGVRRLRPDVLTLSASLQPTSAGIAASLRFLPSQFTRDGIVYQQLFLRTFDTAAPSVEYRTLAEQPAANIALATSIFPRSAEEHTTAEDRTAGLRRFYLPVAEPNDTPAPLRSVGPESTRVEPAIEIARTLPLTLHAPGGSVELELPAYETLGRLAPRREFRRIDWPTSAQLRFAVPQPQLPLSQQHLLKLYYAAWDTMLDLVKHPSPFSGLPCSYIFTGANFAFLQFIWDTSFTAMGAAYGWRALSPTASMDLLYSRQFDGGYIHREHDTRDGMPAMWEPDFSPNPPIMSIAEWTIARLTGDRLRLRQVYPVLKGYHQWLQHNRKLPDGTYWTTGLANGLDNSPSLGDGYPDLTAQMAHDAETLGHIARVLGLNGEADEFAREHQQIAAAANACLWSESMRFYSTSLPEGGHNPNKIVTGFWPLWAGIVPPERVEHLARHLKDPASFWRHHPVPSLAADSPHYKPDGNYWLGSTWAPTNFATIKGFQRAGRTDLARETTLRHLQGMFDVYEQTGALWENYSAEAPSRQGNWAGKPYCWSAANPIALLIEVLLGVEPDAINNTLRWNPPIGSRTGISNLPMGSATIRLQCDADQSCEIQTDHPFTLELLRNGRRTMHQVPAGSTRIAPNP